MEFERLMDNKSSSSHVNENCIVCNSSLSNKKTFQEFPIQSQLTSTFLKVSDSNNKSLTHHLFTPAICTHCGSRQIVTSSPLTIHSFSDYKIKYNEPTHHLDKISRLIGSTDKSFKLKCYSYKDDSLATKIKSQFSQSIYEENNDKRLPSGHTVMHIARRYIEHFTCHESLN